MKGSKAMNRRRWRVLGMFLTIFALGTILLAACTSQGATTNNGVGSTPTNNGGNSGNCTNGAVHTLATTFQESCVNVAKGSSLQVIPVAPSFHNLVNGSWVNGNQVPMKESGAPTVNNVQVASSTVSIGPFTIAGTYHIYCTVHPNMNLTVIVN
jgi:plastocyanin